ncbi:MAG: PAS domain S-box protein [Deltaproteobacteria bacterium]
MKSKGISITELLNDSWHETIDMGQPAASPGFDNAISPFLKEEVKDNEGFFRDLVETVPEMIFSLSPEGQITFLNSAFEKLTGWRRLEWIGRPFAELVCFEQRGKFREAFYLLENERLHQLMEISINLKNGGYLTAEVIARPRMRDGKVIRILGTARDITERKQAEEMLALQNKRIRSLYEISSEPGVGIEGQLVETLKTGTEMLGLEIAIIGHIVDRNYTVGYCYDKLGKVTQGARFDFDKTYCRLTLQADDLIALDHVGKSAYNRENFYLELGLESYIAVPLRINGVVFGTLNFSSPEPRQKPFTKADKDFVRLMGRWISTMIERKHAEDMLIEKEELYRTLVENAHDLIVETTSDGRFLYASSNHHEILGYRPEELLGQNVFDKMHPDDRPQVLEKFIQGVGALSTGRAVFRYMHKDGSWRWFESTGKPFMTAAGEIRAIIDSREITERKKTEEQIQESLEEKEFLLKEIHHRVKNNLQIISSLLSLQSDYVKDKNSLSLINESQNRISTIALVHEQLYQSRDIAEIKMADYVNTLTTNLLSIFDNDGSSIDVRVKTNDISVDIDTAISCGLIINELFSNCLKHAFRTDGTTQGKETKSGTVSIEIRTDGYQNLILSIMDDGIGFPGRLNFRKTKTLGLQLVCTLAEQLNGTIELRKQRGTAFNIKFPVTRNTGVV